jgi:hypothetical protein
MVMPLATANSSPRAKKDILGISVKFGHVNQRIRTGSYKYGVTARYIHTNTVEVSTHASYSAYFGGWV